MNEITAVSEAFSMEPKKYRVGQLLDPVTGRRIECIRREVIYDTGDPYDFYVGYDSDGNKVFALRVQATNLEYN